jgi:hypothetical protein
MHIHLCGLQHCCFFSSELQAALSRSLRAQSERLLSLCPLSLALREQRLLFLANAGQERLALSHLRLVVLRRRELCCCLLQLVS